MVDRKSTGQSEGSVPRPPAQLAEVLKALGDPVRLEIVRQMANDNGQVACTTLESTLDVSKSTISYHIKVLHHAGLVTVRKDGRWYHYSLRDEALETAIPGFTEHLRRLSED